jgi:hypothetical protein
MQKPNEVRAQGQVVEGKAGATPSNQPVGEAPKGNTVLFAMGWFVVPIVLIVLMKMLA